MIHCMPLFLEGHLWKNETGETLDVAIKGGDEVVSSWHHAPSEFDLPFTRVFVSLRYI